MARNDWRNFILSQAPRYGLDPRAAVAVASMEGLSGRVGDGGHAFGPFQMNDAGGVLTNRPGNHRAYAESPQGMRAALAQMAASGARGKTGAAAINAIVRNFERPARPDREVAGAIRAYGGGGVGPVRSVFAPQAHHHPQAAMAANDPAAAQAAQRDAMRRAALGNLIAQQNAYLTKQRYAGPSMADALAAVPALANSAGSAETSHGLGHAPGRASMAALVGKGRSPKGAALMVALIKEAERRGMHVSENAYTGDHVDPVHVKDSDHYRKLGKVGGRLVNGAEDVSGSPQAMRDYFNWASRYAGKGLKDEFYDPMGYSYDQGKRWNKTIGHHTNHVHVSVF